MNDLMSLTRTDERTGYSNGRSAAPAVKRFQRALAQLDRDVGLQHRTIEAHGDLGHSRVHALANVGNSALIAQVLLSGRARLLVESEPSAIYGIAHISERVTLALGAVVDATRNEILR